MTDQFDVTDRNRLRRVAKRGKYDRKTICEVIDACWIGHVAINDNGDHGVVTIPMMHARLDDCLVFHGATSSRLMMYLGSGQVVAVSFAIVDGLVLAKSLFHHSMNYRSVVVFGTGQIIEDEQQKMEALKAISDKIMPGRWQDARAPNPQEMKATAVIKVSMDSASAKIRTGGPIEDPPDLELPIWSGVIPIESALGQPIPDENTAAVDLPEYMRI